MTAVTKIMHIVIQTDSIWNWFLESNFNKVEMHYVKLTEFEPRTGRRKTNELQCMLKFVCVKVLQNVDFFLVHAAKISTA